MKLLLLLVLSPILAFSAFGMDTITFVDGAQLAGVVLFQHPNAPLLVVRSAKNSSVQSFPISEIAQASIAGKPMTFSQSRALTPAEAKARELNSAWVDDVSPKQVGKYAAEKWERKLTQPLNLAADQPRHQTATVSSENAK